MCTFVPAKLADQVVKTDSEVDLITTTTETLDYIHSHAHEMSASIAS